MRINRRRNIPIQTCFCCPSSKFIRPQNKWFCFFSKYECYIIGEEHLLIDIPLWCQRFKVADRGDIIYYEGNPEKTLILIQAREQLSAQAIELLVLLKNLPSSFFSPTHRVKKGDIKNELRKKGWKVKTILRVMKELEEYYKDISGIIRT